MSQFLQKALAGENIVLKSEGTQFFSYNYVADAVSAIFYCIMYGRSGEAYNVADDASDIHLRDLAGMIAEYAGKKVIFELPDAVERAGFSKATVAVMDSTKLKNLGWKADYSIEQGIAHTIEILRQM
jgi:nucleoside-diphosphate-sugar epimerase